MTQFVPVAIGGPGSTSTKLPVGVEQGVPYVLIGPDGTRAAFNDPNDLAYVGWLTSPPTGLDSPEVRENADLLVEQDGGIHGNFFFGRRPVVLEGIIDPSPVVSRDYREVETPIATNLLTNPNFETGVASWTTVLTSGGTLNSFAASATWASHGLQSAVLDWTNAADATSRAIAVATSGTGLSGIPVRPSTPYNFQAVINVTDPPVTSGGARWRVFWFKADGTASAFTPSFSSSTVSVSVTGVVTLSGQTTAPPDAAYAQLYAVEVTSVTTASDHVVLYVDDVLFTDATAVTTFFDGDTPGSSGFPSRSRWSGTAGASTSTLYNVARVPLMTNEVVAKRVDLLQRASRAMKFDCTLQWQSSMGAQVQIKGRRQQPVRITGMIPKNFQIPLVCSNPRIESQIITTVSAAASAGSGILTITNQGNYPSNPVVTLLGAYASPIVISNGTTGESVRLSLTTVPGDTLIVDFAAKTVMLNGSNRYDAVQFPATLWWQVQPGDNTVSISPTPAVSTWQIDRRNAWL